MMKLLCLMLVSSLALAEEIAPANTGLPAPVDPSVSAAQSEPAPQPLPDPSAASQPEPTQATQQPSLPDPNLPPPPLAPSVSTATAQPENDYLDPSSAEIIEKAQEEEAVRASRREAKLNQELVQHEGGRVHFGLDYVNRAFSDYDFDPTTATKNMTTNGAALQLLYFPLTYGYGRFGIGPTVGMYWTQESAGFVPANNSFTTYGLEAQYAALFTLGQPLVPYVLGGFESVNLKGYDRPVAGGKIGESGDSYSRGYYGGGLAINLNRIEHRTATRSLADTGIKKFYLVGTYKIPASEGNDGTLFLGLRLEF